MAQNIGIKREYFMSIVGFYSNVALVDKKLASHVKNETVKNLITKNFLSQAISAAFFDMLSDNLLEGQKILCEHLHIDNFTMLLRRFGVHTDILYNGQSYHIMCI